MIVADTNLISYLLIEGERTDSARRVWQADPDWMVPPLWRSEFLNVLATASRAGVLSDLQAMTAWRRGKHLFGSNEVEPEGERVLRLAILRGISAYDAHFVVVAEEMAVKLHSFDRRLVDRCPEIAVLIE